MEFRQLRYFVAIAEEASVSAASRRLNVSQPPVTRQIKLLEQELGVTLFHRTAKGVTLTDVGVAFVDDARRMLELKQSAAVRCREIQQGVLGTLRVGYFGTAIYRIIPYAIRRFKELRPGVDIVIERTNKDEQVARILDGRLDVGFARYYSPPSQLEVVTVEREPLYLAVNAAMQGSVVNAAAQAIGFCQPLVLFPEAGRPNFSDEVLRLLRVLRVSPKTIITAEDVSAALAMVAIGNADCIVPESVAQISWPGVSFTKIGDAAAVSAVNCIYHRNKRAAVVDAFLASFSSDDHESGPLPLPEQ